MNKDYLMLPVIIHIYDTLFIHKATSLEDTSAFAFVLCGHLLVRGDSDRHLYKDDIILLKKESDIELIPGEDTAFAIIYIQNLYLSSLANYYPLTLLTDDIQLAASLLKSHSIQNLFDSYFRREGIQNEQLNQNIQRFLEEIISEFSVNLSASDASVLITHLLYILNRKYQDNLSLKAVAEELHVIPQYVSSLCRQKLKNGFHNILTIRRAILAGSLLQYTNLNITQICAISGFPNPKSFYQAFNAYYKTTPKAYRNINLQINLPPILCDNPEYFKDRDLYWKYSSTDSFQVNTESKEKQIYASLNNLQNFSFSPADIIYVGNAHNLLSTTCLSTLKTLTSRGKFRFVRLNNLFSENYAQPTIDYSEITNILYSLQTLNLSPMISCLLHPFQNTAECIIHFFEYLMHNYSIDIISRWKFELIPQKSNISNAAAFSDVKNQIVKIFQYIHSNVPEIQIGLNIFSTSFQEEISINFCRELFKDKIIPDFQIANLYPITRLSPNLWDGSDSNIESKGQKQLSKNPSYNILHLKHFIENTNTIYQGQRKKIHWIVNTLLDVDGDNLLNGTLYATTFLMMNILRCQELADQFILPVLLEKYHFRYKKKQSLLQDVQSLFTSDGLPTPLVFALRFLDLTGPFLVSRGPYHLITTDEKGNISCLLINYKHPSHYFCAHPHISKESDIEAIFYNYTPDEVSININLSKPSSYLYEEIFINNEHGSLSDLLIKAHPVCALNQSIINNILEIDRPAHSIGSLNKTNCIKLTTTLKPQEIRMIRLYPNQS